MIWFILNEYDPTTPGYNRFDGLAKGMLKQGYQVGRVYLWANKFGIPEENNSHGIKEVCLWKGHHERKGKVRHLYNILRLCKFLKSLSVEDRVIATNSSYAYIFLLFKKLHIFIEKSEYPELHLSTDPFILRLLFKIYLRTCRKVDGLLLISRALSDYYEKKGVDKSKILIVNMTVDPSRFVNLKKSSRRPDYIAYCGAVSNYKDGVDDLIKAFAIVSKHINDVKLYIIGGFPFNKDKEDDYALVNSLGLSDRVVFTGPVSRDIMPQMLKDAKALVLARPNNIQSRYGFPTKLGEYLLTENPVVLTKVGDIPVFLKDGESTYFAEPGNVGEISAKIIEALSSPNARQIGISGASVAMRAFNSETESKKIIDFIYGQ